MTDMTRSDVVVIGGGLAGLTAAAVAARHGARVTLCEARSIGGRARSAQRDGYVLNEGGHALYRQAGGKAVLDRLGVAVSGRPPSTAGYAVVWDGEIAPLPVTATAILTTKLLSRRSRWKAGAIFARLRSSLPRLGEISVAEWYEREQLDADLRKYLSALLRLSTYSAQPEDQAARLVLRQLVAGGVLYLDGGWQSIVDELGRVSTAAGVDVCDHTVATSVTRDGDGWVVAGDDVEIAAAAVVFAAGGPSLAVSLLGDDPGGWIDAAGPPVRAACLDVGGPAGTETFLLSADEPLYLSAHAPVARLAPPGRHLYSVMRYLSAGVEPDAAANRVALEAHAARAGLPAPADRDIDRFLAAPVVTWGSPLAGRRRATGVELASQGLFAAGDWVGEALLGDAALVSGAAAGDRAAARVSELV